MALPSVFSVAKPVEFVGSGGHKVRPVDVNGVALDDGVTTYSVAHPVVQVNPDGSAKTDATKIFSIHKLVTSDPTGTPVVIVNAAGTTLGIVPA